MQNQWVRVVAAFGATTLLIPVVLYYLGMLGYCNQWWGGHNLFMRSLWVCACPAKMEAAFYPPEVEIAFSACDNVSIQKITRDSYFFKVSGDDNYPLTETYFWQPTTDEKIPFYPPENENLWVILNTDLVFIYGNTTFNNIPSRLYRPSDKQSVPIKYLDSSQLSPIYLPSGDVDPKAVQVLFSDSTQIFRNFGHGATEQVIVLGPNWLTQPDKNFFFYDIPSSERAKTWVQDVIEASHVPVIEPPSGPVISPNGRFLAKPEGIYEIATNKLVIDFSGLNIFPCALKSCEVFGETIRYGPCCWLSDSSAVFYQSTEYPLAELIPWMAKIKIPSFFAGAPIQYGGIVPPVLKVNVPQSNEE